MKYPSGRTADPAPGLRTVVEGTTIYVPPDLFAAAQAAVLAVESGQPINAPASDRSAIIAARIFAVPDAMISIAHATKLGLAVVVCHYLPGPAAKEEIDAPLVQA